MKRRWVQRSPDKRQPYIMLPLGFGLHYAEKGGRLVLRDQTAWHKVVGFWVNTRWGCWWFQFRRFLN